MAITDLKLKDSDIAAKGVAAAPTVLNGTPEENKRVFDRLVREVLKGDFNGLIDALTAATGAGEIGAAVEGLTGATVQAILNAIKAALDAKASDAATSAALEGKADKLTISSHIKEVELDSSTGVFTFTRQNGTKITIDTALEKVAVNFAYDKATQSLKLTLADGSTETVALSDFITVTEFEDSDTLEWSVSADGSKAKATVKAGSITDTMLSSALKGLLAGYVNKAAQAATAAGGSESSALSYKNAAEAAARDAASSKKTVGDYATAAQQAADDAEGNATAARQSAESADAAAAEAQQMEARAWDSAEDAEAWAVGRRNGVDVGADDPAYQKSAKYWAEQAAGGGSVTDEQVSSAVSTWLTAHPEATTTVQDGSVTSQKLNDDICSITEPLASEVLMENASFNRRYADTANNLYFNSYAIETAGENIYKVPVKAGVLYTIIPYSPQLAVYCQSAVINPPSETILGVWTGDAACLGTPSYVGKVDLVNRYSFSLSDRTNKFRYTPQQDGYIVTSYPADTGPMIFKGASPNEGFEEFLNDPEDDWTLNTAPLYAITPAKSERMKVRYGAKLSPTFSRAIRRAEYYQNIVSSSFQMVCIGDSLTFGSSVGVGNRYTDFLQAKLNISVLNWGHNGVTATDGLGMDVTASAGKGASGIIAQHLQRSLDKFIKGQNINNNAFESTLRTHYIFTIFLGTNDWINNAPLGSYGDTSDASTFFNGYKKLVARIRELYPNSALIFITPLAQYYNNLHYYQANTAGYSVLDYNLAIHEIAMMTRNAWVIDMTESAYIKEKESSPSGVYVDTVHIGRKAHILLAHELEKAVMNITMMNGYDYVKLNTVAATDSFAGQK